MKRKCHWFPEVLFLLSSISFVSLLSTVLTGLAVWPIPNTILWYALVWGCFFISLVSSLPPLLHFCPILNLLISITLSHRKRRYLPYMVVIINFCRILSLIYIKLMFWQSGPVVIFLYPAKRNCPIRICFSACVNGFVFALTAQRQKSAILERTWPVSHGRVKRKKQRGSKRPFALPLPECCLPENSR